MKRTLAAVALIAGVGLVIAALFANQIGLDHNPEWGPRRIVLLLLGLLVAVAGTVLAFGDRLAPGLRALGERPPFRLLVTHRLGILATASVLLALAVYVFFLSAGSWTNWPVKSRYYDNLGTAFRAGRLDLNIQPTAALMALPDPYEPSLRASNPEIHEFVDNVVWDLAFYKGKFYLYWGPGPAVLLAFVKLFYAGAIGDQYLAFVFLAGLLVFSTLLILRLRRAFYEDAPVSLVVTGILVAALVCPIPWMVNRAAIYEATIASGQFFLIGGLYLAFTGMERQPSSYTRLLLATVFWAIAATSRTLMLIPAAFLTGMMILWISTNGGRSRPVVRDLPRQLLLGLPFVIGVLLVGWYNWARFGSVFETGLRYTLTLANLNTHYGESFSAYYALPSLWMFLFNAVQLQGKFPFLRADVGRAPSWLYHFQPGLYHTEDITGLVFSAPFVFFSLIAIWTAGRQAWDRYVKHRTVGDDHCKQLHLWISLCLAGSGLLIFAAIIQYFNLTMRFLAEFLPSLVPLAVLGTWQGYRGLQQKPASRGLYVGAVIAVAVISIVISLLLPFSETHGTVQSYNKLLIRQVIRFFGG